MAERPKRYMPFAEEGPRSCIGKTLAQTTLPLTLAILLSHFSFKLADQVHPDVPFLYSAWRACLSGFIKQSCSLPYEFHSYLVAVQMGGPEGVRRAEQYTLVTCIAGGMFMHAIPRRAAPSAAQENRT